jgi:Zn-finger protein
VFIIQATGDRICQWIYPDCKIGTKTFKKELRIGKKVDKCRKCENGHENVIAKNARETKKILERFKIAKYDDNLDLATKREILNKISSKILK